MNREIKFRAWWKSTAMMVQVNTLHSHGGIEFEVPATYQDGSERMESDCCDEPDQYELMQFTGLKDKNGVDIYEGDVVQRSVFPEGEMKRHKPVAVEFGHGVFSTDSMSPILGNIQPHQELEVIGNIYENPDLLT